MIPNFIKVNTAVNNTRTNRVTQHAQSYWLRQEIIHAHYELSIIGADLYTLQRYFTNNICHSTFIMFNDFHNYINDAIKDQGRKKKRVLDKKFASLLGEQQKPFCEVKLIDNFVVNKSSTELLILRLNWSY